MAVISCQAACYNSLEGEDEIRIVALDPGERNVSTSDTALSRSDSL